MEELGAFARAVDAIRPWLGQLVLSGGGLIGCTDSIRWRTLPRTGR